MWGYEYRQGSRGDEKIRYVFNDFEQVSMPRCAPMSCCLICAFAGTIGRHQKNVLLAADPLNHFELSSQTASLLLRRERSLGRSVRRVIGAAVKAPVKRRSAKAGFRIQHPSAPASKRSAIFRAFAAFF